MASGDAVKQYDLAAGIYQEALNSVLSDVYVKLYPTLLKGTTTLNEFGVASVEFDIKAAPTVKLLPSATAKEHLVASLEKAINDCQAKGGRALKYADFSDEHKSALIRATSSATFSATLSSVALTITYEEEGQEPTEVTGSVSASACATVDADAGSQKSDLIMKILSATINVADGKIITELLNKAFIPWLIVYLNTKILEPVSIPVLNPKGVFISTPLPVVQDSYLTAFSALGSHPPPIPSDSSWPKNGLYAAADGPLIEAIASKFFPMGAPAQSFNWEIISGEAAAQVQTPKVVKINHDGSLNASMIPNVKAQLTLHTPWPLPNVSFGPHVGGYLEAVLRPKMTDGELKLIIESIVNTYLEFDWGIPSWINWLFFPLEKGLEIALSEFIGQIIGVAIKGEEIKIYHFEGISINIDPKKKININVGKTSASGVGEHLLVTITPSITIGKRNIFKIWNR